MGSIYLKDPSLTPPFPPGFLLREFRFAERYRDSHGDQLPDTPFWRYLEARYALDPARFRHWHPRVGRWISEIPPPVPMMPMPPPEGQEIGPPPPMKPPAGSGGTVPEPGAAVLMAVGLVWAWLTFRGDRGGRST